MVKLTSALSLLMLALFVHLPSAAAQVITDGPTIQVRQTDLGFRIPTLSDILTFGIRGFFILAGIMALVMLLLGALSWVTSGGEKENVSKAQSKIQAAILGVIIIVGVLAIIVTLEQVIFRQRICLGLSCPISIPGLVKPCGPNTPDPNCTNPQ